jgi:hypothetical protein
MSSKARLFVSFTILSGVCLVLYCLNQEAAGWPASAYLISVIVALIASAMKVRLPGVNGTISVNFLLILISIALFTFAETVLLASMACVVQCLWRTRSRPRLIQVSFNVAALAISSGASYRLSHLFAGRPPVHLAILMSLAATFYFLADTLLISGVLSLVQHKSLFVVWQQCYLWSFPYYLAGAAIAGLAVATNRTAGALWLFVLPLMGLVYVFYRIYVEREVRRSVTDS